MRTFNVPAEVDEIDLYQLDVGSPIFIQLLLEACPDVDDSIAGTLLGVTSRALFVNADTGEVTGVPWHAVAWYVQPSVIVPE